MNQIIKRYMISAFMRTALVCLTVLMTANVVGQPPGFPAIPSGLSDGMTSSTRQSPLLEYRRIFYPEGKFSEITMPGPLVSIQAELFHRRMDMLLYGQLTGKIDNRLVLKSLELSARYENQRLVSGKGIMRIDATDGQSPESDSTDTLVSLSPFRLSLANPVWSSGQPARLGWGGRGETLLSIPPDANELTFNWSLQGGTNTRNELVFTLDLPRFLQTKLTLDLPVGQKLIVPFGIVQQEEIPNDIPSDYRRWHVTANANLALRLIIVPDEKSEKHFRSIGVSERHTYDLSLFGMQLTTYLFLEKSDVVLTELVLELDKPLVPLSVKSGDRTLSWTEIPPENSSVTKLLVSIPYMESSIRDIQVQTFCPTRIDEPWDLPRARAISPLFFWNETRNNVRVNRPLLTRRMEAKQQKEVTPAPGRDDTESDVFAFQAFSEDFSLGIEIGLKQTVMNLESGTSFQWREREMTARGILDLSIDEGQIRQLELDIDANWTVDLIEATDSTRVANYFVEDANREAGATASSRVRWVVPLRQAVVPSQTVRLIVSLRRPLASDELSVSTNPEQKRRYPLLDFMPIHVSGCRVGQQLLAFESGLQYQVVADGKSEKASLSLTWEQIRERFDEMPLGAVFLVGESDQEQFLEIESSQPTCRIISGTNLVLRDGILVQTCRFFCTPTEGSRIDHLTVRFSKYHDTSDSVSWSWGLGQKSETSQQIKATRVSPSIAQGETWELELMPSRSLSFEVTATRVVPFDSEQTIPLPFFPDITEVEAFVWLETRDSTLYHVTQNHTVAVSSDFAVNAMPTGNDRLFQTTSNTWQQHVRGVYQYQTNNGSFSPDQAMLVLEPVSSRNLLMDNAANIWSLSLDSHYYPDGNVVSFATMGVENRTLDRLKIGLPSGITEDGIRNVWIDRAKTSWSFAKDHGFDLYIALPSQQQYSTVVVEYVRMGDKLSDFSVLQPVMPTFNVPVFSRKCHVSYPPDFFGFDASDTRWNFNHLPFGQLHTLLHREPPEFDLFSSHRRLTGGVPPDGNKPYSLPFFDVSLPGTNMPGWVAHEIDFDSESPASVLLVRKDMLRIGQLFVFFLMILVSWRFRPTHILGLIALAIVVIALLESFPCWFVCFASSVFWGLVCAVTFCLVRHSRSVRRTAIPMENDQPAIMTLRYGNDDSESGEVRLIATTSRQAEVIPESHDSKEVSSTEVNSTSLNSPQSPTILSEHHDDSSGLGRTLLLLFLIVTIPGISFVIAKPLSAQPPTTADVTPGSTDNLPGNTVKSDGNDPVPPFPVYIPYDSLGNIGNRYFIPDALHALLWLFDTGKVTPDNWRICKARYVGTLMHNPVQNEVSLTNLRAVYDIELDAASAMVRLPDLPLMPGGVRCDNQLIQPARQSVATGETGREDYVFAISGRGSHQLELPLQPFVFNDQDMLRQRFGFPIPPVPDSTLELTLPNAGFPVHVLQSVGQTSRQSDKWKAQLGPVNQLSVSWPMRLPPPQNMSVSQYFRLHLFPEQAKLHAVFRFNISRGSVRQIQLSIDPRYRPDGPGQTSDGVIESFEPIVGTENLWQITFRFPVTKDVTVEFDCIPRSISGTGDFSGIGTLALPQFHTEEVRIDRSWLGVSSAPSMEVDLPLSNIETRIFDAHWGLPDEPVHHAFDLTRLPENRFLTVKPRPVFRHVKQRQWLLFRDRSMVTYLEEEVTPSHEKTLLSTTSNLPSRETISSFRHEITLPDGFQCETVEIKTVGGERKEKPRIEQQDCNLILFFKKPVIGKYTVLLFGTMICESNKEVSFPLFVHDERTTVERSLFCYRDTSVLVQQSLDEQSVQPIEAVPNPLEVFPTGYFISAFRIESLEHFLPTAVTIRPNNPEITGQMVSRLERNYTFDRWDMVVTWNVTISNGELDKVSIFIPASLNDTMLTPSPSTLAIRPTPKSDGTGTLVELSPRDSWTGEQFFGIRFPIAGTADTVSVPVVQFLHDSELEHYIALPENAGDKPLTWTVANLTPIVFDSSIRPQPRLNDLTTIWPNGQTTHQFYRTEQPVYTAKTSPPREVAFAVDHNVTCFVKRNGFCHMISVFEIQGNEASHCDIVIPEKFQSIQLQLNDIFPLPERVDDTTIRVELLTGVPMQHLTMISSSRRDVSVFDKPPVPDSEADPFDEQQQWLLSLPLPQILSFPLRETRWEVYFETLPSMVSLLDTNINAWDGQELFSTTSQVKAGEIPPSTLSRRKADPESLADMEHDFYKAHFWDDPAKARYLIGNIPHGVTDLTFVIHRQQETISPGLLMRHAIWGALFINVLAMAVSRKIRMIGKRFSIVFVIGLIVFCWWSVPPNIIGWTVLFILLVSSIRIQWNQMHEAMRAVTSNTP